MLNFRTPVILATSLLVALAAMAPADNHTAKMAPAAGKSARANATSTAFKGIEVNGGTVNASVKGGKLTLRLSRDFKIPNTPAPHWQVIDSRGNVFLLKQLKIAGDKKNLTVTVPAFVKDVAKVQIWCSFAEVNLGEAAFANPVPHAR